MFATSVNSFAQKFGLKAGLNFSKINNKYAAFDNAFEPRIGFHVGPTIELPISKIISIESALLLSTKGYRQDLSYVAVHTEVNLLYLDFPIVGKATFDVKAIKMFGTIGPYIGYGLSGEIISDDEREKVKFGSNAEDDFKNMDFGLAIGTGIEVKSIQISLTYNAGLANISNTNNEDAKIKNQVYSISIGYKFGQ